jgi:hypothetical protein
MDRLERFYKIDQLLKDRKVVLFAVFKNELGMSPASVKRDLEYMRNRFNAPIDYDRELNGYRFGKPRSHAVSHYPVGDLQGIGEDSLPQLDTVAALPAAEEIEI